MNKRLGSLLAIIVAMAILVVGIDCYAKYTINKYSYKAIYDNNVYTRNCCDYAMERVIDNQSIVVMGSSELGSDDELAYPPHLFNNGNSDFNMVLYGGAHLQSLAMAINIGALQNNINNGKIVLIISPQWFTETGVTEDNFSSRFEELNFVEFLKNQNISVNTKEEVSGRVNSLLNADMPTLQRVLKDENVYLYNSHNPFHNLEVMIYNAFKSAKVRFSMINEYKCLPELDMSHFVKSENIDFSEMLCQAEQMGNKECKNNDYGINDDYFDRIIKSEYDSFENSNNELSYVTSPEYNDFRLFLQVCHETQLEPLIVSVPLNGRWYDYTGFPKDDRNTYYQNIRDICAEYGVSLLDFSEREYELFFLKDIMHMGWKGWVYTDQAIYDFFKGNVINNSLDHIEIQPTEVKLSNGIIQDDDNSFMFPVSCENDSIESVELKIGDDNTIIDKTNSDGTRQAVFLYKDVYEDNVIRFESNNEYLDLLFPLESNGVYKVKYNIQFVDNMARVSELNVEKINY